MDAKQFKNKLATIVASEKTVREGLQNLTILAIQEYAKSGNTNYIEMIIVAAKGMHGSRTSALVPWIKAHANIVITTAKDGAIRVKKIKGESVTATTPTTLWWEHNSKGKATEFDVIKQLSSFINRLDKSENVTNKLAANDALVAIRKVINAA